ncbi:unnamed protein product, partial [marine sediment metagenome]
IWSTYMSGTRQSVVEVDDGRFLKEINQAAGVAVNEFLRMQNGDQSHPTAGALCRAGAQHFSQLGSANFEIADKFFERAFDLEPNGIYLGWRPYLRTFMLAERYGCCKTLADEAVH